MNKEGTMTDKSRTFPVDPNLPRWVCQNCRHSLCIVGVDSYADKFLNESSSRSAMQGFSMHGANSVLGSTRMDNSFVVLPKQRPLQAQGVPPRPRGGPLQPPESGQSCGKAMDESFVVVYNSEPASDGGGTHLPLLEGGHNGLLQPNNNGFHSTITVLKRAFEIATTQTQVEQPLCLECMRVLSDKLDKEVEDVNRDIEAYVACLQRFEGEARDVLSEADFLKEKLKIEEEERKLEAAIEEIEKQNAEVNAELNELELKSFRFKELEERYWQEFNNFQFQLISHQEERDAILAKTEVSQAHLELLKRSNVLNDAFPIHHDGEFGTINTFRLGRLPKIPVEWDEINAAWGQACLLLHTMCQYYKPKFLYRIKMLPMGSYPRIMDANNSVYDLFGPVNLFWSTRYDKAMTLFLTCLKDFAEFAYLKDQENNIPPEKRFKLPYKIENDKVENHTITQSFNKPENWTKALKYTLCNLKWALYWFIGNTNFQPLNLVVPSRVEVPAVASLYAKRGVDSKSESRQHISRP
ncbi:beclin-1-like protein [Ricinus communis]|uniref:Beclin-1, putative n=1 Tax=Ricinus communis TaxID=3988 RepID=B9SBI9_RICCO|nr:beclin-1-like protein [Ricinus communis]EEF39074.1 Beclin-1, putative [Ricinus communis]|eukprot:XP_002523358.1 beclin-1-like protein [Ricinus communis]